MTNNPMGQLSSRAKNIAGMGLRQQRAAQLRAEIESQNPAQQGAALSDEDERSQELVEAEQGQWQGAGAVGVGEYVVKQGECVSSIAKDKGYFWESIWDHPANSELKAARKDPNVLLADDRLTLPAKKTKKEAGETEMRHRFVRRGEPAKLRLRVLDEGDTPMGNEPYILEVDGKLSEGFTDPEGRLEEPVAGNARRAVLTVGKDELTRVHRLQLGALDPLDSIGGVQSRLANLGFDCGSVDGHLSDRTRAALAEFQRKCDLPPTGEPDPASRARLYELHGS